jgi:hypothetical protein
MGGIDVAIGISSLVTQIRVRVFAQNGNHFKPILSLDGEGGSCTW